MIKDVKLKEAKAYNPNGDEFTTNMFLNTLSRLAALRYGIEFIPGPCDVHCIVRDYDGSRCVSKRISSYDGLSLIGLDPEAHIFKVVDDAIDELEATANEVNK